MRGLFNGAEYSRIYGSLHFKVVNNFICNYFQDKLDAQEKLKLQDKELKDALSQRKLAMAEYTEVTDRCVFFK